MLGLDNGDIISGDASVATKVDYLLHGIVSTTVTQLADGQLSATPATTLYTAGSAGIAVLSIQLTNTDSAARTVNLYLKPSAGTARRLIPVNLSLGIGYTLIYDGQKIIVMDTSGNIQMSNASILDNTAGGTNGEVTKAPTSDVLFDALALKAPLVSPTFTGTVALPTVIMAVGDTFFASIDNDAVGIHFGTAGGHGATIQGWGKTGALTGALLIYTGNAAFDTDVERFRISGGVATAVATWANVTHTGLKLSGALDANGQSITNSNLAPLASPTFTGTVTIPATASPNYTQGIETIPYALVNASGGAVGYTANYVHYLPVQIQHWITVTRIKIRIGTQSGNIDVGIYNSAGTRLVSSGSIACPVSGVATITINSTTLSPGLHYFGIGADNNTATFYRVDIGTGSLKSHYEGSFPLPATMTVAGEAGEQYWVEAT